MEARQPKLAWMPPLLVGASAAIGAEVALAILLYAGPGFVRSLTTILAVEGLALAGGFWAAPKPGPDIVERVRRRWLLALSAFLAAAIYGTLWSVMPPLGEGRVGQGLGLAILAGLPLYATGSVLGGVGAIASSHPGGRLPSPAAPSALGAALGFVLTGYLLPRAPLPASLLVACLVMLSLGGMTLGSVLGSRLQIRLRATRPSPGGDVTVEDRTLPVTGFAARFLLEGRHVRRRLLLTGNGVAPWDVAIVRALMPAPEAPWRVLLIGGGASSAARTVLREHPTGTVEVLERTGAVVALGREHFDTDLAIARSDRLSVSVGNLEDLLRHVQGAFDLVAVDTAALAPIGGITGLSVASRDKIVESLGSAGTVVWGPLGPEPGLPEVPDGWRHDTLHRRGDHGEAEVIIVARSVGLSDLPRRFDGFAPAGGDRSAT
jgi:hypothetical protein